MSSCLDTCCQAGPAETIRVEQQTEEPQNANPSQALNANPSQAPERNGQGLVEGSLQDPAQEQVQAEGGLQDLGEQQQVQPYTQQPPGALQEPGQRDPQGAPGQQQREEEEEAASAKDFARWLGAGEDARMVHDLVTCIACIVGQDEAGKGELVHACFRAYLAAEWAQRKGLYKELTVDQAASLAMYTYEFMGENVYRRMNDVIQGLCEGVPEHTTEEHRHLRILWKPFIRLFTSAVVAGAEPLRDMHLFRGQPLGKVDTGSQGPYSPHRFFSTSTEKAAARRFPPENQNGGAAELLVIALQGDASVYGINLSHVSIFSENERLLFPNQQFDVVSGALTQVAPMQQNPVPETSVVGRATSDVPSPERGQDPDPAARAPKRAAEENPAPTETQRGTDPVRGAGDASTAPAPMEGERHQREVQLRPRGAAEEALEELRSQLGEEGRQMAPPGISVAVKLSPSRTTEGTRLAFKMPSGICEGGTVTYEGPDAGGLVNEQNYRLASLSPDLDRQIETVELLDPRSNGPVQLPSELPPGAKFTHVATFKVSSDEHRRLFQRAGKAWVAFKFGGTPELPCGFRLPFGMQRGGVRIVETMRAVTFCLWYAQADVLSALLICILLAVEGHSGVTYLFPFVDICLQVFFSLRLYWLNGRTNINHPNQLLTVRFPFYLLRLACGIGALYLYITFDSNEDDHVPLVVIVAFKVFTPLSMFLAALFSLGYTDGVSERVNRSTGIDRFVSEKMSNLRYGASIFIFYDACMHGYIANLGHVVGAFLVFGAFCAGLAFDFLRMILGMMMICNDKDNDGTAVAVCCPCPPMCIVFPIMMMGFLSSKAAEVAHNATEERMNQWEKAGGETQCLIALGRWQHERFESLAAAAYWRAKQREHRERMQKHREKAATPPPPSEEVATV